MAHSPIEGGAVVPVHDLPAIPAMAPTEKAWRRSAKIALKLFALALQLVACGAQLNLAKFQPALQAIEPQHVCFILLDLSDVVHGSFTAASNA